MTCNHCGTSLPRGAIFCGECGRRVSTAAAGTVPDAPTAPERTGQPAPPAPELDGPPLRGHGWALSMEDTADAAARALAAEPPASDPVEPDAPAPAPEATASPPASRSAAEEALAGIIRNPLACEQCGTEMGPGDIFCGECGSVSQSVSAAFTRSSPVVRAAPGEPAPGEPAPGEAAPALPARANPPTVPSAPSAPPAASDPAPARTPPPLPTMPILVQSPPGSTPKPAASLAVPPAPAAGQEGHDDVEATRIVARRNGQRFVLQFSTGESVTVYGSGLIGRNPRPEPGEYFDQIVRVLDTGRSVSKTHLEFGQEGGVFWVKDRFSGNGTVLNEPDAEPRRCDPDKRVRVLRGSRVEIGEQFFVVS
jgi:uncharacterized Zn finger protein (UPF0148 family)